MTHEVAVGPVDRCPRCGTPYRDMPRGDTLTEDPGEITCAPPEGVHLVATDEGW